jgi:hypothetical protein
VSEVQGRVVSAAADSVPDMLLTYTLFASVTPTNKQERADVAWPELVERIRNAPTYIAKSACPLISMSEFGDIPTERGCIRHAANVRRVFGAELDYDGGKVRPEDAAAILEKARICALIYTTPSHTPEAPRWRALLPFSEPMLPEKRAEYLGRANRILGGIATRESFTLSQSFYIGRVRGAQYVVIETIGRTIDTALELEPLPFTGNSPKVETKIDSTTDDELRAAFVRGEGRYQAMLKLSARWARQGDSADDIAANLHALMAKSPGGSKNADGIDLAAMISGIAQSAIDKYGDTRSAGTDVGDPPPVELPPIDAYEEDAARGEREYGPTAGESEQPVAEAGNLLRPLYEIVSERREPKWLQHKVLEAGVLAVLAGPRSTFKSFIALDWMMRSAIAGHGGVILSGEGAGLDRRVDAWLRVHGNGHDLRALPIYALERPKNLNLADELLTVSNAIAALPFKAEFVIVDTLSKFSAGLDENSNFEVAEFLSRVAVGLRDLFGCTVLLVAHSGHGDAKRPRGASALMANPDAEYIVARPDATAMTVTVTRERFKDYRALEPLAYEARVVDLGRSDSYGEPVTSLALVSTDLPAVPRREPVGKAQRALLEALRQRKREGHVGVWTLTELRALARGAGFNKGTARSAVEGLSLSPHMVATVGGYRLSDE